MGKRILVDTSYLYALYDKSDKNHSVVANREVELRTCHFVIAWPMLYETVNTRLDKLVRGTSHYAAYLKNLIKSTRNTLVDAARHENAKNRRLACGISDVELESQALGKTE